MTLAFNPHLNRSISHRLFAFIFFLFSFSTLAQSQSPSFCISSNAGSQDVVVNVTAENFTDILSVQFSIQWDPNVLSLESVGDFGLSGMTQNGNFGLTTTSGGALAFSWLDGLLTGETLANGATLFSMTFNALTNDEAEIEIKNYPTPIEVSNIFGQVFYENDVLTKSGMINGTGGVLSGNIFDDSNLNCSLDMGEKELRQWVLKIENSEHTYYTTSDANGHYSTFIDIGTYDVSVETPNLYWESCQPNYSITLANTGDAVQLEVPLQKTVDCPAMEVDITAPILRRCFSNNKYTIDYCNNGTSIANGAYIEITFDPFITVESSSLNWSSQDGNTYTFDLGDVDYGDCGNFDVTVTVSCDAILGATHCTEAHIFPDEFCEPPSAEWSGASLAVTGVCNATNDSIIFSIGVLR